MESDEIISSSKLLRLTMLSKLSLPENIFLAAFLAECHQYLSSISNSYCFLNKKRLPSDIYDEVNQLTLSNSIASLLKKLPEINLQCLQHNDHIVTSDKVWKKHALKKPYHQTFFRSGYHQSLILPVMQSGNPSGLLIFNRNRSDKTFDSLTIKQAKLIRDVLETGLLQSEHLHNKTTAGWRSGLIIVDQRGEMTQCCPEGYNLLALALQRKSDSLQRSSFSDVRNLPGVIQLIDKLLDTANPTTNGELTVKSVWGDFQINGFPVLDDKGKRAPHVYLNITWQVPFSLMLFHNIRYMCFTPRQEIIGLLYAAGESTKSIANKLELSLYTVKEHVQHIFERLQIHTRAELIEHIICRNDEATNAGLEQTHLHRTERTSMDFSRPKLH